MQIAKVSGHFVDRPLKGGSDGRPAGGTSASPHRRHGSRPSWPAALRPADTRGQTFEGGGVHLTLRQSVTKAANPTTAERPAHASSATRLTQLNITQFGVRPPGMVCEHRCVAKSLCTCGRVLLWKFDEPDSDEWRMIAMPDYPEVDSFGAVLAASSAAVLCPDCGRLWVQWHPDDPECRRP